MESVPNFSEGRNIHTIEKILNPFRNKNGIQLLDFSRDEDHNRMVATIVGQAQPLKQALIEAVGIAVELINLNNHQGEHPRIGAADVIPFIPLQGYSMNNAIKLAEETARELAEQYNLPIFLYEKAATCPRRANLANVRRGQFEGLDHKLQSTEWRPDFGPDRKHPTAGATAVGARMPLIAFNVNLDTNNLEIAKNIARKVRESGGGLPCCKAIAVELHSKGIVQVSMNLTDYTKTSVHQALEAVQTQARQYGVNTAGTEIIGMIPAEALADTFSSSLGINNFSAQQILPYL